MIHWKACRDCGGNLRSIYDFGLHSLHCVYPAPGEEETFSPLHIMYCTRCTLHQLSHSVESTKLYKSGYGYKSGLNSTMKKHFEELISYTLNHKMQAKMWLDIGCNDGTLLNLIPNEIKKIGIDPQAPEPYIQDYFSSRNYFQREKDKPDIITSIAMIYDLDNLDNFIKNVSDVLNDNGVWIVEFADLFSLYAGAWDVISHEHVTYLDPFNISLIAARHGLYVKHFSRNSMNGGSSRLVLSRGIPTILKEPLFDPRSLSNKITNSIIELKEVIQNLLKEEKKIWVLGASQKGNTLLQALELTSQEIPFAIERMEEKRGLETPGSRIPIIHESDVINPPDYYLILPWHLKNEIINREKNFKGSYIFPLPNVEVL